MTKEVLSSSIDRNENIQIGIYEKNNSANPSNDRIFGRKCSKTRFQD